MTLVINQLIQQKSLSFDEFLAINGESNRHELSDGEVFDLEPTGQHEEVVAFIAGKGLPWFVLQRGLLHPSNIGITAF